LRLAIDIGGTFTDLVVDDGDQDFRLYKTPTVPDDPATSVIAAIEIAARDRGSAIAEFLSAADLLIHATTRGLNAILTGTAARTGLVTTRGHPDILVFREGGRQQPFNNSRPYPPPYVPRRLTYEVTERVAADGRVLVDFDEANAVKVIEQMRAEAIEAVAVCFIWSIVNPTHEQRFGHLLDKHLPDVPYTLSHELNPCIREYRRASSACIDASLKPVITQYVRDVGSRLREAGFLGRLLMVTSGGGLMEFHQIADTPIHSLGSGPAMAPVAARHYAKAETTLNDLIVADAGGTSYDVSLVRRGRIPTTRETWLGHEFDGHITGFPSIDVKSIGAGGGSIAWVDEGKLLHVGPQSAGAHPGPACYGQGSMLPTLTDACLVLGFIDPRNFLGGRLGLDTGAASAAIAREITVRLGLGVEESAAAILDVVTERMAQAVEEVSTRQGIAPASAVLVAGGGAAGFNCVAIARRVGAALVVVPEIAAGMSAAGALLSDLMTEFRETFPVSTTRFDVAGVNDVLSRLQSRSEEFLRGAASGSAATSVEFFVEARYPDQVWEIEMPLTRTRFATDSDIHALRNDFHRLHREFFAVSDEDSEVEVIGFGARARGHLTTTQGNNGTSATGGSQLRSPVPRRAYFGRDWIDCPVYELSSLQLDARINGPAIVESPSTTIVLPEGSQVFRGGSGSLLINPLPDAVTG